MIFAPWMKLVAVLIAITALCGIVFAAYNKVAKDNFRAGRSEAVAEAQATRNKELAAAQALILQNNERIRSLELAARKQAAESTALRRKLDAEAKAKIPAVAATVRDGLAGLCDGAGIATGQNPDGAGKGEAAGTGPGNDAANRASLFATIGDFLSGEAAQADEVTRKLGQAQAFIRTAIATCN